MDLISILIWFDVKYMLPYIKTVFMTLKGNIMSESDDVALNEMSDKYIKLLAEFENYRNRTEREKKELIETANSKLLLKLCDVADNFDRAFDQEDGELIHFYDGIELINEQFTKVLTDSGLQAMNPIGEEFDPSTHDAISYVKSDTVPESHITVVYQKGYKFKEKVIRPAKVVVSSGN